MANKKYFKVRKFDSRVETRDGNNKDQQMLVAEAFATKDTALFRKETDGKTTAFASLSVAAGDIDFGEIIGCSKNNFLNVKAFGKLAENLENVKKGDKLVFVGTVQIGRYESKKNPGTTLEVPEVILKGFVKIYDGVLMTGGNAPIINTAYVAKSGDVIVNRKAFLVAIKVNKDGEMRSSSSGKTIFSFLGETVGESTGSILARQNGDRDVPESGNNLKAVAFGYTAERAAKVVRPDQTLLVWGTMKSEDADNGKTYYDFIIDDFIVALWPPKEESNNGAPASAETPADVASSEAPAAVAGPETLNPTTEDSPDDEFAVMDDGEDDELPF